MRYALESSREVKRLEAQNKTDLYDFRKELAGIENLEGKAICDAGCGSAIVSRYLADSFPTAKVTGCDFSEIRIQQCKNLSKNQKNLEFSVQDITNSSFDENSFDFLVSRFVLEHLPGKKQRAAVREFHRVLKPDGKVCLIDIDGLFFNLYPLSKTLRSGLRTLKKCKNIDLFIGRKLPEILQSSGFVDVKWNTSLMAIQGSALEDEKRIIRERFEVGEAFFTQVFSSSAKFRSFKNEYLLQLESSCTTLFYTKWLVTARKSSIV